MMSILEVKGLQYSYENKKRVLRGINAQMEQGKMYAILGPSGCGKTTLLSLLGGLDSPSSGQILYQGEDISKTGLADHRRSHVAFIFQSYNLIDYLTPVENVALTARRSQAKCAEAVRGPAAACSNRPRSGQRCTGYFG